MRVAVIGSGVTGLVAARTLHGDHEITVYERNDYLGGHAHTVVVQDHDQPVGLDTGFIVFNHHNYPHFSRLLEDLGVASQPSEMSFGVSCLACGIEYSSRGVGGLFAHRAQALSPRFYRMTADIIRFNRWAGRQAVPEELVSRTVGDLRKDGAFSNEFLRHYLLPMSGAIWSSTGVDVDVMPLSFLLTFFRNHGLLQTHRHPRWRTVTGGSQRYVDALSRPFIDRVRLGTPVRIIRRHAHDVEVKTDEGWERFDTIVLATHTDQALRLLQDPSTEEHAALAAIGYRRNEAVLHTDASVLAAAPAARASWNCHVDQCRKGDTPLRMTYDLNRLQGLATTTPYLVTLNDDGRISPNRVLARMTYSHPVYTIDGLDARRRLRRLSGQRRTIFCGAYMGNGFHEDGVRSGLEAAELVAKRQEAA